MIILLSSESQYFWTNYVHGHAKSHLCLFSTWGMIAHKVSYVVNLSVTKLKRYWYSVYKRAASAFTKSHQNRYLFLEQTIKVAKRLLVRVVIVCG